MLTCLDDVRHMTDKSSASIHRNRRKLIRKQPQQECFSKANRQLVKRNPPSSSGATDLRISSPNTFTRNGVTTVAIVTLDANYFARKHRLMTKWIGAIELIFSRSVSHVSFHAISSGPGINQQASQGHTHPEGCLCRRGGGGGGERVQVSIFTCLTHWAVVHLPTSSIPKRLEQ
ncbi:unnamed protein product [Protopolystoma xenopodis]|uniref:Uncharacterized protein n=1 Tax=Protopolystoma xenopodis TaxID=117903 RepID=A0A448XR02_9PLAT|nr:unnamed protein product [Protopolystoma xenopodis]